MTDGNDEYLDGRLADAAGNPTTVAQVLAEVGRQSNEVVASELDDWLHCESGTMFRRCAVVAMEWAGWVSRTVDTEWRQNALEYLSTRSPFRRPYSPGYQGRYNVGPYLDTWHTVLSEVPGVEPARATSAAAVLRFEHDAFTVRNVLEWKRERSGLGAWTFYGTFKIYLLMRDDLWGEPQVNAIRLPMGGQSRRYSFERGWERLRELGVVPPLAPGGTFSTDLVRYDQAHAEVLKLARLGETRALHINSAIYVLGRP